MFHKSRLQYTTSGDGHTHDVLDTIYFVVLVNNLEPYQIMSASRRVSSLFSLASRTSNIIQRGAQQRSKHYLAADSKTFDARMKDQDGRLVIVDFYADWCGPCKMLSPILERITSDTTYSNGKEVDLVTINADEEPGLTEKFQVRGLPTVIAFRDGKPIEHFVGAAPANVVQEWIKKLSA